MTTKRPHDWPQRLSAFLDRKERLPFEWGRNDCCLFVCDWLRELTGEDFAAPYRGYDSALAAARVLKEHGGVEGIAQAVCAANNWPEVPVSAARRGDVVAAESPHGLGIGICCGAESVFAGNVLIPTLSCVKAWRVL